ncbi:MAG TPA: cbb3-type cytochrome c oxidase subunit I [Pseudonocardiaceae bacterium]|nr:cbb3-type cytochrome c oxidase subunit I [Pseudonocardiaceae bacterium]
MNPPPSTTAAAAESGIADATRHQRPWLTTTDHKRIAILTGGTALVVFFAMGVLALLMRYQLSRPDNHFLSNQVYDEIFTIHGSGMIYLSITPFALAIGLYLVPLQIGAPNVAAPRVTMAGFWLYLFGAVIMLSGFSVSTGTAQSGWTEYTPLSDSRFSPGAGQDLWIAGVFLSTTGLILIGGTVLWTVLLKRARGMTMLRLPVLCWSVIATNLMVLGAFPALLAALGLVVFGRMVPSVFMNNIWNIGYQNLFWFYAHPVVYVMFFPFVGAVCEVLATFSRRRFFGYTGTALALLVFAALSMSVWGHHMFTTGQAADDYYSLTSISLLIPAGIEYFGMLGTILGGRLVYRTPMLFALAFIPQFLIGGLTGIMVGTPVLDYQERGSYFVVAHFHYTLLAGSVFGLFAGMYFWFPKMTGRMLSERLGRWHFWLMVIGTNATFLPMFWMGMLGMPRRVASYLPEDGIGMPNLISSCGAAVLGIAMLIFAVNLIRTLRGPATAPDDPWGGFTLEWATSSPPPPLNFQGTALPPITSYAPLLDQRERAAAQHGTPAR